MTQGATGPILRLSTVPNVAGPGEIVVVIDTAWTPATDGPVRVLGVRDTVDAVFSILDPISETSTILDAWASQSEVIDSMIVGETSIWYHRRLAVWLWLQERVIWVHLLNRLADDHRPSAIRLECLTDSAVIETARLVADARGLPLELVEEPLDGHAPDRVGHAALDADVDEAGSAEVGLASAAAEAPRATARHAAAPSRPLMTRVLRKLGLRSRPPDGPTRVERNTVAMVELLESRVRVLASAGGRPLLVVLNHHAQRIETADGPRHLNPYLGTVADRLRGTEIEPILLDWRLKGYQPAAYSRLSAPGMERVLSQEATRLGDTSDAEQDRAWAVAAHAARDRVLASSVPAVTAGIDLAPLLSAHVADIVTRWLPSQERWVNRFERLLRRLPLSGILVADEYHRQDWMEAARRVGLPVFAIQHGTIYRQHRGYVHRERPRSLRLPHRTYVYGRWERDVLVEHSVYLPSEVVVGGSPRLDLFHAPDVDRAAIREELGIAEADLLLVLSGTWGSIYRQFHYPAVLARLFDRPMPGVHLVVKQHPAELDEGPYRRVVEGVAAAGGFAPPPITLVRDVDLYRLLGAADAHLGVHSTVLTEAVVTGTPNLLATSVTGGDLLDYVASGVATPVSTSEDLRAALRAAPRPDEEDRRRFIEAHFEPGNATQRIAADIAEALGA